MEKHCFLASARNSLFKQLVASLLIDLTDDLKLHESKAIEVRALLDEIAEVKPDMVLLDETSPFVENSLLVLLLITNPGLPVIVINEDSNLMHIVRRETQILSSSNDLIEAINLIQV